MHAFPEKATHLSNRSGPETGGARLVVCLLGLFFAMAVPALGQGQQVSGTVTDAETGETLPGVNIVIEGTSQGAATDAAGHYTIPNVEPGTYTLVATFVGYADEVVEDVEVTDGETTTVNFAMQPGTLGLEEVVVVGYGEMRKADLTGSISSVDGEEVTRLPTQKVGQALQGRIPGVMIRNTNGAPGGTPTIRIRGMNSIYGGNNALVVIDGLQGGDLSSLNPNNIASIEVLKGPSATAIYGSQGANGVILITTKIGRTGKPTIRYGYDVSAATLNNKLDLLSAANYAREINAVELSNNGSGVDPVPIFTKAEIQAFEENGGTDWQDVIYRTAITQNHQLSISGATNNINYLVSGAYLDQEGILINSGYQRYSLRANIRADIIDWLSFGLNWAGSKETSNSALFGGSTDWPNNPIGAAIQFSPTISVYDASGTYNEASLFYGNSTLWNPLASAVEPVNEINETRNNLIGFLEFELLEGLTLKINGGATVRKNNDATFYNTKTFIGSADNGTGEVNNNTSIYLQNTNLLTYEQTLDVHHITLQIAAEQKYYNSEGSWVSGSDFLIQETGVNDLSGANIVRTGSFATERAINSYFWRVNYSLYDKYLFTGTYRADGSSVFGKNNKWGYFPSGAIAWRASEETFIENLGLFSNLKFRASWGITGNQAISPYQTLARISSGGNYPYSGGSETNLGFYISSAANPSLKWETTTQTNFGVDIGLFKGRLTVTADYYNKVTDDLLMPRELPGYSGLSSIIDNVGSMQNRGIEIAVNIDPVVGNFNWHSQFNFSANRTKVLDLGATNKIGFESGGSGQGTNPAFMYLIEGESYGQMIGWGYEGVWDVSEAEEAAKYGQLPGDPHYTDVNNDGKINTMDKKLIGNSMPDFIIGWGNQMSYKNFDLTFLIQGVQGNNLFNVSRIALESPGGTGIRLMGRWTPQNQDSNIPAIIDARTREEAGLTGTISFPPSASNITSRWVEDGSYIRLRNISLAYNFPASLTSRLGANNIRIYVGAMNLITITEYSGYTPEVSSFTGNDAQIGSDYNSYPMSLVLNLGINLSF